MTWRKDDQRPAGGACVGAPPGGEPAAASPYDLGTFSGAAPDRSLDMGAAGEASTFRHNLRSFSP